jgi:predicted nucleotidyltransferase
MKTSLEAYRQRREALITEVVKELSIDERFLAAWLTGSYARNDADQVSDLDLQVVIAAPYSEVLCARKEQVSHKTTEERLALFSRFGRPALIHENNNNAPEGGTFTFVLYADSALMVDWTLLPQKNARRPFQSRLLFDKANIPISAPPEPEELEQRRKAVLEQWAFFWMMTAVTTKYIIWRDGVFVSEWLEHLHELIQEIERQLHGEPRKYIRGSLSQLQPTPEKQLESIRSLSRKMQTLASEIEHFSGTNPALPIKEIETLLALADEDYARH